MALSRFKLSLASGALAFAVLIAPGDLYAEPRPYQLHYAVYRNGKLAGEADINMQQQGKGWIIRSDGSGTRGLGRLLGVTDQELVEGHFLDDRFRPDRFTHQSRLAGISDNWSAQYDWQEATVVITKDKEALSLDLGQGALDKLSLNIELQGRLREQNPDLQFFQVTADKIKPRTYRLLPPEELETSLGCMSTLPVELVPTGSTTFSRSWHATGFDYLPVRIERGKTNGTLFEMRIAAMVLDGRKIDPLPPCTETT